MVHLIVVDNEEVDTTIIPWKELDGLIHLLVTRKPRLENKHLLKEACIREFVKFHQVFVIPPTDIEQVPQDLIRGCGLLYDKEVIIYGTLKGH